MFTFLRRNLIQQTRLKSTATKWKQLNKEILKTFDNEYSEIYRHKWHKIRKALLSKHNYIALVNNFSNHIETERLLEAAGAINLRKLFSSHSLQNTSHNCIMENKTEYSAVTQKSEYHLTIPNDFNLYTIPDGDFQKYPQPVYFEFTKTFSHILINGASILPVIALDIQPNDRVLDACSAPGTKSFALLQVLQPFSLVCNDIDEIRIRKIRQLFNSYLIDAKQWIENRITITQADICDLKEYEGYDKILVDVPCSTDRHVITDQELLNKNKSLDKANLITLQTNILVNCIRLLKAGGSLVYSTCSLNPKQNDGVVEAAISIAEHEHQIMVTIRNMTSAIEPWKTVFEFDNHERLQYGQLVIPTPTANYGPLYFSKMIRHK